MIRSILRVATCAVVLWFGSIPLAAEPTSVRVTVLPFTNSTGEAAYDVLSVGFADLLTASLSQDAGWIVVDRSRLDAALRETGLQLAGITGASQTAVVGRRLGAQTAVTGGITRGSASTLVVTAHAIDVETGQVVISQEVEGRPEELAALGERLARALLTALCATPGPRRALPVDERPEVTVHFLRGLGNHWGGLYDQAVAEFMLVLVDDPGHAEARLWLGKSYAVGGDREHARIELERFRREFPSHPLAAQAAQILQGLADVGQ